MSRLGMARALAYFYLAGAALVLGSLLLPSARPASPEGLVALCALACAAAVFLHLRAARVPGWLFQLLLAAGSVAITAAVYLDGDPASVYGLLYLGLAVEAFCFLRRWQALLHLALSAAAYGLALVALAPVDAHLQRWVMTAGTALMLGLLVGFMRTRIERLLERLTDAARKDALTGLPNRRAFEELFAVEIERSTRTGRPLSVLVGDVDGLARLNERLGEHAGDVALEAIAGEIGKWKRRVDTAARYGGEEFALLLPETDERGAFLVAERLRRAVHRTFSEGPVPLTISFGIATHPDHGEEAELLLRAADQALQSAKDMGSDRVVIYSREAAALTGNSRDGESGELRLATLAGLAEAIDIRDTGSARHARDVGRYAGAIARELGLDPDRVERVRLAGVLHDVGKVGICDRVLTKPGPLDDHEWEEIRMHPVVGARLLSRPEFADLRDWVLAHHERPDGSGYPFGLTEAEIPLEARILAVADAYEAMTADRAYRPAMGEEAARAELTACAGEQFDRSVVDALLRALSAEPALALQAS